MIDDLAEIYIYNKELKKIIIKFQDLDQESGNQGEKSVRLNSILNLKEESFLEHGKPSMNDTITAFDAKNIL
ncbi:MAG: hypothetical protein ACFE9I_10110 [Candidatus Hermodarchaeota archaeon]